ncbi:MAG: anti-sigma factor family protein [Planctomycetota bacterium]|jgi:hypothetical protein
MSPQREKLREQLSAYLDGELSDAQARDLEQALQRDPDLSAELDSLRKVSGLVRSLPRARAPEDLADRVLERVERGRLLEGTAQERTRPAGWWLSRLATAAVVLIAVGAGAFVVAKLSTPSWVDRHGPGEGTAAVGESTDTDAIDAAARTSGERSGGDAVLIAKGGAPSSAPGSSRMGKSGLAGLEAGGLGGSPGPDAPVRHFYMNTDNIVLAKADVERVLASNGIVPAAGGLAARSGPAEVRQANVYGQRKADGNRIEFEVAITPQQMREICRQLDVIRAAQTVPQDRLRSAMAMAARDTELALEYDGKSAGGAEGPASVARRSPSVGLVRKAMRRSEAAAAPAAVPPSAPEPSPATDRLEDRPVTLAAAKGARARSGAKALDVPRRAAKPRGQDTSVSKDQAPSARAPAPCRPSALAEVAPAETARADAAKESEVAGKKVRSDRADDYFWGSACRRIRNELEELHGRPEAASQPATQSEALKRSYVASRPAGRAQPPTDQADVCAQIATEVPAGPARASQPAPTTRPLARQQQIQALPGQRLRRARGREVMQLRIILKGVPSK